ncbi:hypothetical protein CP10139811_0362 [Chlamydia ibidis]|uniref:Uncharacterized protein n=2 Tax=Chlamydia ibidis TaxID=1405396 RepID=S7KDT4_9CHLA|nr:hypothetical protein [Chlamydia ibidis]EPP34356.1 hypothetical protein CP10139811_0362 [Chlamydia ibidis]EQM63218.1 hypothetical protein H359_0392 [Chlamydia ibidis 10-1398/6]
MCNDDLDAITKELSSLQEVLHNSDSLDVILDTYERMFVLIYKGMGLTKRVDQQCHLLSLTSDGTIVKDSLGDPVTQPFVMNSKL